MLKNLAQDDANSNSKSQSLFDGVDQPSALPVSVYIRYWSSYLFHEDWLRNFVVFLPTLVIIYNSGKMDIYHRKSE